MHNLAYIHCGWPESAHQEITGLGRQEENDSSGFEYSLRNCPGYTPNPTEFEELQKLERERNPYLPQISKKAAG